MFALRTGILFNEDMRPQEKEIRIRLQGFGIVLLGLVVGLVVLDSSGFAELRSAVVENQAGEFVLGTLDGSADDNEKLFAQEKIFGYSLTGKPISGYEIGTGDETMFLVASIHGNEMGGTDLLNRFLREIIQKPELVSEAKKLIIIPIANPDGYFDRIDKLNANEVNINRNFATSDWRESVTGETSAGERPFSEPESIVLKDVVEEYRPALLIAYHALGTFVTPEKNDEAGRKLAKWYAQNTGYAFAGNDDVWDFPGTFTKWFVETTGNPGITVEMTTYLGDDWELNRSALLELVSSRSLPF